LAFIVPTESDYYSLGDSLPEAEILVLPPRESIASANNQLDFNCKLADLAEGRRVLILLPGDADPDLRDYARNVQRRLMSLPERFRPEGDDLLESPPIEIKSDPGWRQGRPFVIPRDLSPGAVVAWLLGTPRLKPEPSAANRDYQRVPFDLKLMNASAFAAARFPREFLVQGVLVANQPCIGGGPRKALKTSVVLDLAISLASESPFLGVFPVPHAKRVMFLSGESGEATIQETAFRVAHARGLDIAHLGDQLHFGFHLPSLSRDDHLEVLAKGIRDTESSIVVCDPLYLCLLGIGSEISAANIYQIGPLLKRVADACLENGATPVLLHHFKRNIDNPYDPPDLDDLAFAGVTEFARQWLLFGRRSRYQTGTGEHELWLSAGGSAGHSGGWALNIREGVVDEDFGGRVWNVEVHTATEIRDAANARREQEKELAKLQRQRAKDEAAKAQANADVDRLVSHITQHGPTTANGFRGPLAWGPARVRAALDRAISAGVVVAAQIAIRKGKTEAIETAFCSPQNKPQVSVPFGPVHPRPDDAGRNALSCRPDAGSLPTGESPVVDGTDDASDGSKKN
jgi:replicative DNA helicase